VDTEHYDLLIIGGGINGAGIARDAAGRGLKVLLVEQGDLASATSSASTKLIHGGLRYLEYFEFRLVAEALAERETLLAIAPHIVWPLEFVLPHESHLRPAWMIRAGLFLYDHLGHGLPGFGPKSSLPASKGIRLDPEGYGAGLKPEFERGFVYYDCWVDDARLVVLNARSAAALGATILTRTRLVSAKRENGGWVAKLAPESAESRTVHAAAIVNAAGPWVRQVLDEALKIRLAASVRLVKGSHIVVPRVHAQPHAYILQNPDKRVVFVIPYEERFSLIGTTDVPVASVEEARAITADETRYLLEAANRFLARPLAEGDIVSSYAGVRPLYDDGSPNPSEVTRDYVLKLDAGTGREPPLITIFGGKITTYRRLAEEAMARLAPFFPGAGRAWTANEALPGGGIGLAGLGAELQARYPDLDSALLAGLLRRHGTRAPAVLGDATHRADLGRDFGAGLTEREVGYMCAQEWARTAEDVLWRRSKCGLHMTAAERAAVRDFMGG
jgi:glycerol-3-phosphate dehydrogenase